MPGVEPGSDCANKRASTCVADLLKCHQVRKPIDTASTRLRPKNLVGRIRSIPYNQLSENDALRDARKHAIREGHAASLSCQRVCVIIRSYLFSQPV